MKRANTAALAACLLFLVPGLGWADEPEISLLAETGWVRIQLVLGRLEVANIGSSQTRAVKRGDPSQEFQERLAISSETVIPTVRYLKQSDGETLSFAIVNGQQVELVGTGADQSHFRFEQQPGRDLLLEVRRGKTTRTFRAPSLWHLLLEEPGVCQKQLVPALQWLQPSWRLQEFIERTEDELVAAAVGSEFQTARQARRPVARLDSADYRTRQAASDELRALGIALLPYLEQLDRADLSREQRQRLSRLKDTLRDNTRDTPERVARWLVEDERTWLTLLEHRELVVRQLAVAHLGKRFPKTFGAERKTSDDDQLRKIAALKARYRR